MRPLQWLEEIIWPRALGCLCCEELCPGRLLCPDCQSALDAMKLPDDLAKEANTYSVYRYDGIARQLVVLLKDQCMADAADVLAQEMANAVRAMNLPPDTVLTWVTMPEIRRKKRGIDHGRTLCEAVAKQTGMPMKQLLIRSSNSHTQRGLNREARLKNISNSICSTEAIKMPVLLIDDVLTTGATVSACTNALLAAGAPNVFALTATKVVLPHK